MHPETEKKNKNQAEMLESTPEATWFEYFENSKPGSRSGTGGRKIRNESPRAPDKNVINELRSIKYGKKAEFDEATAQKLRSFIVGKGYESLCQISRDGFFCRKVPFAVLKDCPIAKTMRDFVHMNTAWYLLCPENQAHSCMEDLKRQKTCVVLVGNRVSLDVNDLIAVLPYVHGLALSANNLSPVCLNKLFSELQYNDSVHTLSITENSLVDKGCSCVQSCLAVNEHIASLVLSSNEIGDDGAKFISEVLMPCKCFSLMEKYLADDRVCDFVMLLKHGYPSNGLVDSLLQKAVNFGSVRIAEYLLDQKADPCSGADSKSCLSRASALGHLRLVELLISRNADIAHRNSEGRTALSEAACNGHDAVIRVLIKRSRCQRAELDFYIKSLELIPKEVMMKESTAAKRNSLVSWFTLESSAMHPSSMTGSAERSSLVCEERSSKLESREHDRQNRLEPRNRSRSELFLKLELNSQIKKFCIHCPPRAVELEINQNASFIITEECCISHDKELIIVLGVSNTHFEEAVGPDEEIIGRGKLRLISVGFSAMHHQDSFIRLLSKSGGISARIKLSAMAKFPFLNETSKIGNTALHEACRKGYVQVVYALAQNGADVDCKDQDENTPLITSSRFGFEDIVKTLLSFRTSPQSTNRARVSALMTAQRHNFANIVQLLQCHEMAARRAPLAVKRLHLETRPVKTSEYEGTYKPFSFQLTIVEGRNFPTADVTGLSDPFCRVTFSHQEKRTRVVHRSLNPKWNQTFVFDNQLLSVWEKSSLLFEIFDSNIVTDSTLLGRRKFNFEQFISDCSENCTEWMPSNFFLEGKDGFRVQDSYQIDSELQIKFQISKGLGQFLRIGVIGAANLPLTKTRNSEAFCVLQYGDEAIDTPSLCRGTSVSWNFFVNFKAKRIDETLRIELRDLYASKQSIQETECLAILEIPPSILLYFVSSNLSEMDFEIYDREGNPLKGPGGHISSLRLEFALTVFDPLSAGCSEWLTESKSVQNLSKQNVDGYDVSDVLQDSTPIDIGFVERNEVIPHSDTLQLRLLSPTHTNNFLVNLNLDQNKVSDLGVSFLAHSLKANHVLQSLSLNENKFGMKGATALSACLAMNSCLSHLRISKNQIRDEGLREVCKALASNIDTKIKLLDVGENHIGAVGMRFLGRLFACNHSLQTLLVNNNCAGGDGSFLLAQGLRKNSSIQELDLSFSVVGDIGVSHLAQSLRRNSKILGKALTANRSLKIVNFSGNSLTGTSVKVLIDCVQHNQVLHTIIMNENNLPSESLTELRNCIEQNLEHAQLEKAVMKIQHAFRSSQISRLRKANGVNLRHALNQQDCGSASIPGGDHDDPKQDSDLIKFNENSDNDRNLGAVRSAVNSATLGEGFETNGNHNLQGMLMAATSVTMFNLGDAVILEHEAAHALAQEAATKLSAAAENYSRLEDYFYHLMLDENSNQTKIVSAVDQLSLARESILKAIEESRLAEEAGMKCLQGADAFAICETEEAHIFGAWHDDMKLHSGSINPVKEDYCILECQDDHPHDFVPEFQGQKIENRIKYGNSNQIHDEVLESQESDEDLIASAFKEFFCKNDDEDYSDCQAPTGGLEQLQNQLSVLRDEEIAACSSAALEELDLCMKEISVLKQLIAGHDKRGKAEGMLSAAAERCSHLESSVNQSMGCVKGQEFCFSGSSMERLPLDANESHAWNAYLGVSNSGPGESFRVADSDETLISDAFNEFFL
jgi:ankyrin repeat protein/Ran GTPase-activating protein (RanGAP) involved in mRNA processing and transport